MLQKIRETCYSGFEAGAVVVFVLPPSQEFICEPLLGVRGVGPFHPQDEPSLSIRHVQWRLRCGQHRRRHMQLQRRTCSCTDAQGAPHGASKTPTQAWNLEPAVLAFEKFFDLVEGHRRFDAYTNSRFDAYTNSRFDAYINSRFDAYTNSRFDAYTNSRFDAYTNSRFDAYINSLQTIDEMIPGDEMTDDPRFLLFFTFF